MPHWLEQALGACLVLVVLLDVFLTVLYTNLADLAAEMTNAAEAHHFRLRRDRPTRRAQQPHVSTKPNAAACAASSTAAGAETRERQLREAAEGRLRLCERQLVELNHRVANTLQILSSLLEVQLSRATELAAKEALDMVAARLHAIALLHRHLCCQGGAQRIDIGRFIEEIAPTIAGATGLTCEPDVKPVEVPGEAALHLVIAVNELVFNARKHAYGGQDGGSVTIGCRRDRDGRLRLSVADRGCGLPEGFDQRRRTGLGMGIVHATLQEFGGELYAETDQGARFTLLLAVP